jgi:hypothetical protein
MPAVFEKVMFGPIAPAAVSAWQLSQAELDHTDAPLVASPALDEEPAAPGCVGSSLPLQAVARAASAALNKQIVPRPCSFLKIRSLFGSSSSVEKITVGWIEKGPALLPGPYSSCSCSEHQGQNIEPCCTVSEIGFVPM